MKKCKVIVFPGSNCDNDCAYVLGELCNLSVAYVWHKEATLGSCDFIVLPGGFSYGDYLRTGAIARFSPIMTDVIAYANAGHPVIGICNGFQVLLESGLLPGAMLRNKTLHFICEQVHLKTINNTAPFTNAFTKNAVVKIPIAHGEGNYFCDDDVLKQLQDEDRIAFRYASVSGVCQAEFNPNGSRDHIAGIMNKKGNVLGMMPHPERVSEDLLGGTDGMFIWQSIINYIA